jgi:hypothetical protein
MLDAPSLPRALAVAVISALCTAGCCSTSQRDAVITWPADVPCPSPDIAALYMSEFSDQNGCGASLVSIDDFPVHTKDGCTYLVTTEHCECMEGL